MVKMNAEEYERILKSSRTLLQTWENYRAMMSRKFPENPPPQDRWEVEMEKWAEQTRKMLEGKQP